MRKEGRSNDSLAPSYVAICVNFDDMKGKGNGKQERGKKKKIQNTNTHGSKEVDSQIYGST